MKINFSGAKIARKVTAEDINNWQEKKPIIKIENMYLQPTKGVFVDTYLTDDEGEPRIKWVAGINGKDIREVITTNIVQLKILLEDAYIYKKILLEKKIRGSKEELHCGFGLEDKNGIKFENKFYKWLFRYDTHFEQGQHKGEAKKIPGSLWIRNSQILINIDIDSVIASLQLYKFILGCMILKKGAFPIEVAYYRNEKKEGIGLFNKAKFEVVEKTTVSKPNNDHMNEDVGNSKEIGSAKINKSLFIGKTMKIELKGKSLNEIVKEIQNKKIPIAEAKGGIKYLIDKAYIEKTMGNYILEKISA